jgi:hypothetical protein
MSWDSEFAEPIDLPNHVVATTLHHVIAYISELPDAERNSREWQNAHKISFKRRIKSGPFGSRASRSSRHLNTGRLASGDEAGARKSSGSWTNWLPTVRHHARQPKH